MQYRIGEVQKILGISAETLRYFETMNIIEAKRNEHNRYRYYETEDINKIFAYKMYRSMEFTMEEAMELISGKSIEKLHQKMQKHKTLLENRKNVLEAIISNLIYSCNILEKFYESNQPLELGMTEDMFFFENQEEDRFVINEEKTRMIHGCLEQLHNCVPMFCCTYRKASSIRYGYGIRTSEIKKDLAILGTNLGNQRCFHGVVKVRNQKELYDIIFEQVKLAEDIYHLECNSKIYGRMHHEEREKDKVVWYHEIWALIKEE